MGSGELQLAATGAEDIYLSGNPQITFFKAVYQKYTKFATEHIPVTFDNGNDISETEKTVLTCKLPRHGDLVNNLFFVIDLPSIISDDDSQFKWVEFIGETMIESIAIYIGGTEIERFSGEWIHIYHKMSLENEKKIIYNKMIGHVEEIHNPDPNLYTSASSFDPNTIYVPTIVGKRIYVPIPFWFSKQTGLSLPMIALQYHEVEIRVEIKPFSELYTILKTKAICSSGCTESEVVRSAPNILQPTELLDNFIYNTSQYCTNTACIQTNPNIVSSTMCSNCHGNECKSFKSHRFDAHLEVGYIYLDDKERKMFAKKDHEYLIEQVQFIQQKNVVGKVNHHMKLYNPIKQIFWMVSRNDNPSRNQWFNFTNWHSPIENPFHNDDSLNEWISPSTIVNVTPCNFKNMQKETINSAQILINKTSITPEFNSDYWNYVQPFLYNTGSHDDGVYSHSFSLDPSKYQPTGALNASRINDFSLVLETKTPPEDTNTVVKCDENKSYKFKYNLHVYVLRYNILKITGGMGSVAFAN